MPSQFNRTAAKGRRSGNFEEEPIGERVAGRFVIPWEGIILGKAEWGGWT